MSSSGQLPGGGGEPTFLPMISDDLDLQELATEIKQSVPGGPIGYLRGKSLMRDLLVSHHRFSELEAEELVDTMEQRGYLRFLGDPTEQSVADSHWAIEDREPH